MNLKKYLTFSIFLFVFSALYAQKSDTAKKATVTTPDTSANYYDKIAGDGFIGFGFVLGNSNKGAKINYGESREFIVGLGVGYRFVKCNAIGMDLYYKSTDYFLAQDSSKILPDNNLHKSEKLSFNNFGGLAFDRFYIGDFYLDGGFYFDWTFYTKHITWDIVNSSYGSTTKVIEKQLDFTNETNYGLTFRFGKTEGVSLYFNYRLSNLFKPLNIAGRTSPLNYPELPAYVLGVVIATHQ